MKVDWKIFTDTKKEKSADIIYKKIVKQFLVPTSNNKYETYYKDNTQIIYFNSEHKEMNWENLIYQIIENAQQIGRFWTLYGHISNQTQGRSTESNISGIVTMEFFIEKK